MNGFAIPPGDGVGTIGLHGDIGEIAADGISDTGELAEVHGEKGIGESFVLHERCDHGGGDGDVVPSLWNEGRGGDSLALGLKLGGGLEGPMIAKKKFLGLWGWAGGFGSWGVGGQEEARSEE